MRTESYLQSHYSEPVPQWLAQFEPGGPFDAEAFFASRVVYYPGSGNDGHAVQVFAGSHSAHCFVYADYVYPAKDIKNELNAHGFRGYSTLARIELTQSQLGSLHWTKHITPDEFELAKQAVSRTGIAHQPSRFGFVEILERNREVGDEHGAHRIALLFLGADGHATFDALFCQDGKNAPFAILLQDHGFGGDYSAFGVEGLMARIAQRTERFPNLLLVARNTNPWENYEAVSDLEPTYGGMHNESRQLFCRVIK